MLRCLIPYTKIVTGQRSVTALAKSAIMPEGASCGATEAPEQWAPAGARSVQSDPYPTAGNRSIRPPLDLWLNGRIARFQARLKRPGQAIRDACAAIKTSPAQNQRGRGRPRHPSPRTEAVGRKVDRATNRAVGRAGKAKGAEGLDSEMDRGQKES